MPYFERQKSWGRATAAYEFLAGVGGGVFLFSFILDLLNRHEPIARIGALLGPVLVFLASFLLLAHLGSKTRVYRLFFTLSRLMTSWMVKGTWILMVFIIFSLAYSLPSFELFKWIPWGRASGVGQGIGIVAALLSVLVVIYQGFLFGVAKGIPFWNTSTLPLLFLLSGLVTGVAALVMIALFFTAAFGVDGFHQMGAANIALIFMQLIVLGAYLEIARHAGTITMVSIRLLRTPIFIGGALIVGLLLPLGLLLYGIFVTDALSLRILAAVTSLLLLAGGLFLRYSIIRAGVFLTVR